MYQRFLGFLGIGLLVVGMVGVVAAAPTKPEEPVPTTAVAPLAMQTLLPDPTAPQGCNPLTPSFQISPNLPITDLSTITSTMNISGIDPYLWDVNLYTNITHTFPSDLEMFLISPAGTKVTISTDNLFNNNNAFANTTWDDQWVGSSITDWPLAAVAEASPEGALGAFVGEDPNGLWQLVVHDDATEDEGALGQWRLEFTTLGQAPIMETVAYSQVGTIIPDEGQLNSQLTAFLPGRISDVNLKANLIHPRTGDLDIYLAHPTGITITLASDVGGGIANGLQQTVWNDSAATPVTDWLFANGTPIALAPENGMAAFNGLEASGLWTLVVEDDTPTNVGTLLIWNLTITTASCVGDASVTQWHWPYPAPVGGDVGYAIVVSNAGVNPLNNLVLTDTLPVSTTFKSWTAAPGWDCQTPAVGSHAEVVCTVPTLAGGEVVTHYLNVATAEQIPMVILENFVEIATADPEISLGNNNSDIDHYRGLTSANGNVWDVADNQFGGDTDDDGHIQDGGQDAFDGWGHLHVLVADENQNELANAQVTNLGMAYGGHRTWTSQQGFWMQGIQIGRQLFAPAEANYVRYVDTFTNEGAAVRHVSVVWGGDLGSDNHTTLAATSSGNLAFDTADEWAVTIDNDGFNPAGPTIDPPVGYLWRGPTDTSYQDTALYENGNHFDMVWPGNGQDALGYLFQLTLQPGETATLVYFVYRGLAEELAGPGSTGWGYECLWGCVVPSAGSEIALAQMVLGQLAAEPDFCGISEDVLATVVNWPNAVSSCPSGYLIYLPLITR